MTLPADRALLFFCLFAYPAVAFGQTKVEATRAGAAGVNTGVSGGATSALGNNTGIGAGSIKAPTGAGLKTAAPAPAVNMVKGAVQPAAAAVHSALPGAQVPAAPAAAAMAAPERAGQVSAPGAAAASGGARSVTRTLDREMKGLKAGQAPGSRVQGDAAVMSSLDRIFDLAQRSGRDVLNAAAGVKGTTLSIGAKIKKTVALANTSAPRDAPDLYKAAIKTAQESLPPDVANSVRSAVLSSARDKAEVSLADLANGACRDAAAGMRGEVQKALKAFDKWESLLGSPGQPLVSNLSRLRSEIERVLDQGPQAAAEAKSVPRIWFARSGWSYTAVLPARSLPVLPANLAETLALRDAAASVPFSQAALLAFQARPTAFNGARLVYRANREAAGSVLGSAFASAGYWFKAVLGRIWRALRGLFMGLTGRGRAYDVDRGFSVATNGQEWSSIWGAPGAYRRKLPGGLEVRSVAPNVPAAWSRDLTALAELEAACAAFEALAGRQAPLDMEAARDMLRQAGVAAAAYRRMTGDPAALSVAEKMSRRLEAWAEEGRLQPRSALTPAMAGMLGDEDASLRQWLVRVRARAQDAMLALPGKASANAVLSSPSRDGGKRLALVELSELNASGQAGVGPGLRAVGRALSDHPGVQGDFLVQGDRVLARWSEPGIYGKIYAQLASTERGGIVRLLYQRRGGAATAAAELAQLGFAVEARGDYLSAVLDAETSRLGPSGVADALVRALARLQRPLDPPLPDRASGSLAGAEAGVARLVAYIQRHRDESAAAAVFLQSAMPEDMYFDTIGRVGDQLEVRGRMRLQDGATLVVYALRDPGTGIISHARAELDRAGTPLSLSELRRILPE